MIKSLIPTLSKEVGRSTALVFQQLVQWFKNNEVVYRTNQEIADDLEGIVSVTTVQRAKMKLIESGYLSVSFDKGHKRTTHYRLTEKAKGLLQDFAQAATEKVKAVKSAVVKKVFKSESTPKQQPQGLAETKGMKEAFEDYGKAPEGRTGMPDVLKRLISGRKKTAPINEEGTVIQDVGSVFKSGVTQAQKDLYSMKLQGESYREDF